MLEATIAELFLEEVIDTDMDVRGAAELIAARIERLSSDVVEASLRADGLARCPVCLTWMESGDLIPTPDGDYLCEVCYEEEYD